MSISNIEDILIDGERVISSLTEGNLSILATNKRLIRVITTNNGIGVTDLSYNTVSSINVFFNLSQKYYFWLSALGIILAVISGLSLIFIKNIPEGLQLIVFIVGIFLLILGTILKRTESYAGLELLGERIPKTKTNKIEVSYWNFRFRNVRIEEILEFMKVVRGMVNHYSSSVEIGNHK